MGIFFIFLEQTDHIFIRLLTNIRTMVLLLLGLLLPTALDILEEEEILAVEIRHGVSIVVHAVNISNIVVIQRENQVILQTPLLEKKHTSIMPL